MMCVLVQARNNLAEHTSSIEQTWQGLTLQAQMLLVVMMAKTDCFSVTSCWQRCLAHTADINYCYLKATSQL